MKARNTSVTFHVDVYDSKPWFQVPRAITKLLELKSNTVIAISISRPNGELLYHGLARMGSGTEIYRAYVSKKLKKGEEIRVTVSRPPEETVRLTPRKSKAKSRAGKKKRT
jgi:hypothetical protein